MQRPMQYIIVIPHIAGDGGRFVALQQTYSIIQVRKKLGLQARCGSKKQFLQPLL